eukprot:jgi/Botrbrau1/20393/Bobra.0006s0054.1
MAGGRPVPQPGSTTGKEPRQGSWSKNPQTALNQKEYFRCSCTRSYLKKYAKSTDLGELKALPHELLEHVFPGLPQATIMELSTSSRDCREAARKAIPRVRAALVDSLKDGCKWATPAQLRTMTSLVERLKACRHINTDQPLPLVGPGRNGAVFCGIGPKGKVYIHRNPDMYRPELCKYAPTPVAGKRTYHKLLGPQQLTFTYEVERRSGGAGAPSLHCSLGFDLGNPAYLRFDLDFDGGRVLPRSLISSCSFCDDVDLLQALVLKFWPIWGSGGVFLTLPIKSPRECAAIIAGCGDITWEKGLPGERHLSADTSSMESSTGWDCSRIVIWTCPCLMSRRLHR